MADNTTIIFNQVAKTGTFGSVIDAVNSNFDLAKIAILNMKGKSAYELWKDEDGNENKTLDDFWRYLTADKGYEKIPLASVSNLPLPGEANLNAIYVYPDPEDDSKSITAVSNSSQWIILFRSDGNIKQMGDDIEALKLRNEPIVFTGSKELNALINHLFLDVSNFNGETAIDSNSVYVSYTASTGNLSFFRESSGGTSFLTITLNDSILCKQLANGIYYYIEADINTLPLSDVARNKVTVNAFSPSLDPRTLNNGFTINPVINKYISNFWVEIPEDYDGDTSAFLNKLCIFRLANKIDNVFYKQYITICTFGDSSNVVFYYNGETGEPDNIELNGYGIYSALKLHATIDWKSLRGKDYAGTRYDYLTNKAYSKAFYNRFRDISDNVGNSPDVAFSQKGAKELAVGIDERFGLVESQLPELTSNSGEFVSGYYSTSSKQTIGESGQTAISSNESFSCFKLELSDTIATITLNVKTAGDAAWPYYFLDENNELLYIEKTANLGEKTIAKSEIPTGAKFLYVNNYLTSEPNPSVTWKSQADYQRQINNLVVDVNEIRGVSPSVGINVITMTQNKYYSMAGLDEGDTLSGDKSSSNSFECAKIVVEDYILRYQIKCRGVANQYAMAYPYVITDSDGEILLMEKSTANTGVDVVIKKSELPEGAAFIYINNLKTFTSVAVSYTYSAYNLLYKDFYEDVYPSYIKPYIFGKKVLMLGDSLTEFKYSVDGKGVVEYFAEYTKADVVRGGIGGSHLSRRKAVVASPSSESDARADLDVPSIVDALCTGVWTYVDAGNDWLKTQGNLTTPDDNSAIVANLKGITMSEVDIITIFAGTNDANSVIALGEKDDNGSINYNEINNIYGAINYIVKKIHDAYPSIAIYIFTPVVRWWNRGQTGDSIDISFSDVYKPSANYKYLYEICETILDAAKFNHIPCCDLYWGMGWNKYNFARFLSDTSTTDGTHPSRGYKAIAHKMATFILSNICR